MSNDLRTEVHFRSSAFNTTEPRPYFINPCCYGDDLCRWLMEQLRAAGLSTDPDPDQEDFGWYFGFTADEVPHTFVVGYEEDEEPGAGLWRGWIEQNPGFISSLAGGRKRGVRRKAAEAIHTALASSEAIREIAWYPAHDKTGAAGTPTPIVMP